MEKLNPLFKHVPCNLCGKDQFERWGKPRVSQKIKEAISTPEVLSIVRCQHCGFYYTDPTPFWSELELQYLYDSQYFPPLSQWWEHQRIRVNPQRRLDIMEQHACAPISNFLEIGCGWGYALREAMRRGWRVYGQEVSHTFATMVKESLGIDIFVGQLAEASYPDSYFNAIYVDSVLEHTPEPIKMFEQIHRLLKPGGIAYLTITNEDALINVVRDSIFHLTRAKRCSRLTPLAYPYHIVGFTPDTFIRACEATGFNIKYLTVCSGRDEWRKYHWQDIRFLLSSLACYPLYLTGESLGRGIAIEAALTPRYY